ncbi:MAG: DUF4912 domain-containing protein [Candidatus Margulisiibacteriota bacterium]
MPLESQEEKKPKKKALKKTTGIVKKTTPKPRKTTAPRKKRVALPKKPLIENISELNIEESKYFAGPVIQKFEEERSFEFPAGYGDNRIILLIRDPYWLYSYWEISDGRRNELKKEIGEGEFFRSKEILRVYDTGNWEYFDVDLGYAARCWYVHVPTANRTYCVEIGYLTPSGKFFSAARSNWVKTPLDRMSDEIDEEWMIPDWNMMYALSGGFGSGKSSQEVHELMKSRMKEELSSGWVSSLSSPANKPIERPFWLVANCELIVYGATEPSATVTVQGRKIDLKEDGSFSLRFSLPDGQQVIPIEAIRDDGQERRNITPTVERKTK